MATGTPISTKHRQLKPLAQRRQGSVCRRYSRVWAAVSSRSWACQAASESESKSPVSMPNAAWAVMALLDAADHLLLLGDGRLDFGQRIVRGAAVFRVAPVSSSSGIS